MILSSRVRPSLNGVRGAYELPCQRGSEFPGPMAFFQAVDFPHAELKKLN